MPTTSTAGSSSPSPAEPVAANRPSDAELLARLLAAPAPATPADVERCTRLLDGLDGLRGLGFADVPRLRHAGLSEAQAATLGTTVELARRLAWAEVPKRRPLNDAGRVAAYLLLRFGAIDQEVGGVLYLDRWNGLMGEGEVLYRGSINRLFVEPRQILKRALLHDARGIIAWHNHPSGDPEPTIQDRSSTRRLAVASEAVGIRLVDHLVLGTAGRWASLT